jgi:multidrug resistance efflux pump
VTSYDRRSTRRRTAFAAKPQLDALRYRRLALPPDNDNDIPGRRIVRNVVTAIFGVILSVMLAGFVAVSSVTMTSVLEATLQFEPVRVWPVIASRAGVVVTILDSAGTSVHRGQLLVRLDSRDAIAAAAPVDVFSPSDGLVWMQRPDDLVGSIVHRGDRLMQIADTSSWDARGTVHVTDSHNLRIGDRVALRPDPAVGAHADSLLGTVKAVEPEPSPSRAAVEAKQVRQTGVRVSIALDHSANHTIAMTEARRGYPVHVQILTHKERVIALVRGAIPRRMLLGRHDR